MPKVSIIVPVYKTEKYLNRCIDSILVQTFTDFELILVDDGSPDRCGEICDEYADRDSRIKVIHKKNGGLSEARNFGLEIVQGDFIGFVDSDDYIESDMYESLYNACIDNDLDLSMCGRYDVYKDKKTPLFTLEEREIWTSDLAISNLLIWNNIDSAVWDKLFKRTLFNNIRFPVGKYNEDIYILPKIIHNSQKIVHIGEPKYYYYHRFDSITTETFSEKKLDLIEAADELKVLICKYYTNHKTRFECFYFTNLVLLNSIIQPKEIKKKYNKSYKYLYKLLLKDFLRLLFNPYLGRKIKLKSILILTGMYTLVEKVYPNSRITVE